MLFLFPIQQRKFKIFFFFLPSSRFLLSSNATHTIDVCVCMGCFFRRLLCKSICGCACSCSAHIRRVFPVRRRSRTSLAWFTIYTWHHRDRACRRMHTYAHIRTHTDIHHPKLIYTHIFHSAVVLICLRVPSFVRLDATPPFVVCCERWCTTMYDVRVFCAIWVWCLFRLSAQSAWRMASLLSYLIFGIDGVNIIWKMCLKLYVHGLQTSGVHTHYTNTAHITYECISQYSYSAPEHGKVSPASSRLRFNSNIKWLHTLTGTPHNIAGCCHRGTLFRCALATHSRR